MVIVGDSGIGIAEGGEGDHCGVISRMLGFSDEGGNVVCSA